MNESIASIDVLTRTVTIYPLPHQIDDFIGPMPYMLTITPDGYVWFTLEGFKIGPQQLPPQLPAFGTLDSSKNLVYIYYIQRLSGYGTGKDIKYHSNYIWVRTMSGLLKVSYANLTSVVIEKAYIRDGGLGEGQMKFDGNNLWITCTTATGLVTRFNTVTEKFDLNLTGFDRPLGIEVDNKNIYVAENKWYNPDEPEPQWGTVAIINKITLQVTRVNVAKIIYDGPYSVLKDSIGYLWFTDNSGHIGIVGGIVYGNEIPNCYVPPYCYFMAEVPVGSSQIWFSAVGSAHVGVKDTGTLGKTDINLDGKVDMKDVGTVARYFGQLVPPAPGECDINSDGKVDMRDVGAVARNFGKIL
jgi:hypothetical protein